MVMLFAECADHENSHCLSQFFFNGLVLNSESAPVKVREGQLLLQISRDPGVLKRVSSSVPRALILLTKAADQMFCLW